MKLKATYEQEDILTLVRTNFASHYGPPPPGFEYVVTRSSYGLEAEVRLEKVDPAPKEDEKETPNAD